MHEVPQACHHAAPSSCMANHAAAVTPVVMGLVAAPPLLAGPRQEERPTGRSLGQLRPCLAQMRCLVSHHSVLS